jgi:hypothetical protein
VASAPAASWSSWDGPSLSWIPDRSLRLLILTQHEASLVVRTAKEIEEGQLVETIGTSST